MKSVNILLLCMLGAALLSTVRSNSGSAPVNCCFNFVKNRMNKTLISSHYKTDSRCAMTGIVLTTTKGRAICVDAKQSWVKKIIDFLEKKIR